jgi:peptidoglycan/LPS O-acetylase OafA/YrhL
VSGRPGRFALLDSMRAIAALLVFGFHLVLFQVWQPSGDLLRYATNLNVGVPIFFVISGFLLYRPMARRRMQAEPGAPLVPYAARRLMRIVPAFWLALAVSALLLSAPSVLSFPDGLLFFGFGQVYVSGQTSVGLAQAWSICVELTFYAFLPLWAWLLSRIPVRSVRSFWTSEIATLAVLFAAGVVWKMFIAGEDGVQTFFKPISPLTLVLPNFFDHFALGMGLAVVSLVLEGRARQPGIIRLVERWPLVPWLLAVGLFAIGGSELGPLGGSSVLGSSLRHEIMGLVAAAVVLPAIFGQDHGGLVRRFLAWPVLLWIGMVSYGVYLWHVTVIRLLVDHGFRPAIGHPLTFVAALGITLLVAGLSWYLLERHAITLGHRVGRRGRAAEEPGETIADPVPETIAERTADAREVIEQADR